MKIGTFIQFEHMHLNLCKVSRDSYMLLLGLVPNSISILLFFLSIYFLSRLSICTPIHLTGSCSAATGPLFKNGLSNLVGTGTCSSWVKNIVQHLEEIGTADGRHFTSAGLHSACSCLSTTLMHL